MKNKGFTLIELLVVITLIGILLVFLIPKVRNIVENSKQNAFAVSAKSFAVAGKNYFEDNYSNITKPSEGKGLIINATSLYNEKYLKSLGELTNSIVVLYNDYGTYKIFNFISNGIYYIDGYEIEDIEDNLILGVKDYITDTNNVDEFTINNKRLMYQTLITSNDASGANVPVLKTGMIPVYYDTIANVWKKADVDNSLANQWYNYSQQKWANVVTVTAVNRAVYTAAAVGTTIPMIDINAFYVWIPKYEYRIQGKYGLNGTSTSVPGEIEINFISKATVIPSSGYRIHPSFTFNSIAQAGIWVGKFETGGSLTSITIVPQQFSMTEDRISDYFNAARDMEGTYNNFGFVPAEIDTHLTKNTDWGAVAYLSQSRYGKYGSPFYSGPNKEIYDNLSYVDPADEILTGCSSGMPNEDGEWSCIYTYDVFEKGTGASTSGTIYGIYDMSNGQKEYVMGNLNNTIANSGFVSMPPAQYYDVLTQPLITDSPTNAATACGGGICYGQAMSETESWYKDDFFSCGASHSFDAGSPWLMRSGLATETTGGIFTTRAEDGGYWGDMAFRIVITSET